MSFDLGNLLQQFTGAMANPAQGNNAAAQSQLSQGLGQAFRSDQTPPFAQMAAQLFGNSDPTRRAGMLNQILSSVGPGVLASLASGGLGNLFGGNHANRPGAADHTGTGSPGDPRAGAGNCCESRAGEPQRDRSHGRTFMRNIPTSSKGSAVRRWPLH